jgi:hypothetical protein
MYRSLLLTGLLVTLASCSSSNGDPAQTEHSKYFPVSVSGAHPPGVPPVSDQSAIPKGAQYTLFCTFIQTPLHVEQSNQLRKELIASTGMHDWYVVHQSDRSSIYYGYYRSITGPDDPREAARAQADRQKVDRMTDKAGNHLFARALFVELTAPDPVTRPEWNLLNAQGAYTIQIGVYKGSPQRKEAAVEAVRQARAQGVEAYYLHGQTSSMVCVGAWPASALVRIDPTDAASNSDPSKTLMVVPETGDLSLDKDLDKAALQNNVQLVRPTVKVVDASMIAAMKQFPYNSVNGNYIMHQSRDGKQTYDPSYILPIPERSNLNLDKSEQAPAAPAPPGGFDPAYRPAIPRQTDPTPPPQPNQQPTNIGKLKSITGG